jgi:hypothetical protein
VEGMSSQPDFVSDWVGAKSQPTQPDHQTKLLQIYLSSGFIVIIMVSDG